MTKSLNDYKSIVGDELVDQIYSNASSLDDKWVSHVNSTLYGGGVAEILGSLVLLMNDVGIETSWKVVRGDGSFFRITKKIHNALHGDRKAHLDKEDKLHYMGVNESNSIFTHIEHYDAVIVHDNQPLPLIKYCEKCQPWVWRCHIDVSNPNMGVLNFLKKFISRYDLLVFHLRDFMLDSIPKEQTIMPPSIDPLSKKNSPLTERKKQKVLKSYDIPRDKPIITQVSRFDKWKDPKGVMECFKKVKKKVDCRLVFVGSFADDDPEGEKVYKNLLKYEDEIEDMQIICQEDPILVNAMQDIADVVIQKSIKEGFGLTVSEALWKGTPVVAGNVGGIKLQIKDGYNGYLVEPHDINTCAKRVVKLLQNEKLREEMGKNGKEHVRQNFLITRHLNDWINILKEVIEKNPRTSGPGSLR